MQIGEEYDIIGFDPRGIGLTEYVLNVFQIVWTLANHSRLVRPATRCFPSPEARTAFIANTVLDRGYDVSPNLTDPDNGYHLIQTQRDADALYKTQFAICAQTMGDGQDRAPRECMAEGLADQSIGDIIDTGCRLQSVEPSVGYVGK